MITSNRLLLPLLAILILLIFSSGFIKAETLDSDSPEFAAQAESKIYKIKKNSPESLKDKISGQGIEVDIVENRNYLVIKALPEKMKKIEEELKQIEDSGHPHQVKYNLYIIELQSTVVDRLGLRGVETPSAAESDFYFFQSEELTGIGGEEINSNLVLEGEEAGSLYQRIAEPTLITTLNSTAAMTLSKDINYIGEDITDYEGRFELEITPLNINDKEENITTSIEFTGTNNMNTNLSTEVRTDYNKPELIGVARSDQTKVNNSIKSNHKEENDKYFAFYITAQPISTLPESESNAFNLGGMDQLLFSDRLNKPRREQLRFLYNSGTEILLEGQDPELGRGFTLKLEEMYLDKGPDVNVGPDFYLVEELKLGTRFNINYLKDRPLQLKVGLEERVKVSSFLDLSAGYYPLYYDLENNSRIEKDKWWVEGELSYSRFYLNLKYKEINYKIKETSWRSLLGCEIIDPVSVVVGVEENENKEKKYLGGISLRSW